MGIEQYKDVEKGGEVQGGKDLEKPLIQPVNYKVGASQNESLAMVLLCTFVAVCGSFEFGSCVGYSAPTQSSITDELKLSISEFSMFGSIITIGAMLGAITSGRVSDFIGRKGAMRLSSGFCITGWLAVFISKDSLLLDIGRFSTGYGIGVLSYVVPVYIAEIAPKNLRGGLTTVNQFMIVLGSSNAFLLGSVITWRSLALTGIFPCIVMLVGLFFIPESPRWLAKVGRGQEFKVSLRRLRGKDADISEEAIEIENYIEVLQGLPKAKLRDLFQSKHIRAVTIGVGLMVFQQLGGVNGIGFYASETFASAGPSSKKFGTITFACIQIPITLVGALMMDKCGRKPLMMVSASGTFLGSLVAGTSFFLKGQNLLLEWVPTLAVAGVLIFISAFSIGMGAVPWVIMSEILYYTAGATPAHFTPLIIQLIRRNWISETIIFPLHVKGAAGSLVVLLNWFGAWAVTYTYNFLMSWNSTGTFSVYAGFSLLTILFVAKVVPETKGKTLEEIQVCISNS